MLPVLNRSSILLKAQFNKQLKTLYAKNLLFELSLSYMPTLEFKKRGKIF